MSSTPKPASWPAFMKWASKRLHAGNGHPVQIDAPTLGKQLGVDVLELEALVNYLLHECTGNREILARLVEGCGAPLRPIRVRIAQDAPSPPLMLPPDEITIDDPSVDDDDHVDHHVPVDLPRIEPLPDVSQEAILDILERFPGVSNQETARLIAGCEDPTTYTKEQQDVANHIKQRVLTTLRKLVEQGKVRREHYEERDCTGKIQVGWRFYS